MKIFWDDKYNELAVFNADNDKKKYTEDYINRMESMQKEYNEKIISWAIENNIRIT